MGDQWMAILQGPTTGFAGPFGPFDPLTAKLEVALTSDLETWTHHKVPLNLPARIADAGADLESVSIRPTVLGGGRHEDTLAVQVAWYLDVAWELQDEGCGAGRDDRGVFLIRCDGSIDVMLDGATIDTLGLNDVEWYVCLLYTSPSPRDGLLSRMPSSA